MAQADWIRYGNEGGAKAQQIARLREMFGNVGAFTPTQVRRDFYGGDQQISANVWDLQNQNVSSLFKQMGINPVQTRYDFAEPRQVQDSFDQTNWSPYQNDEAMLQRGYTPTGVSYVLPGMADPEREGKKGFYTVSFNADGTLGDVAWQNQELSKGFLGDNMSWLGPLMVGGLAALGTAAGGAAAGAGGTAAGGTGASSVGTSLANLGTGSLGNFGTLTGNSLLTGGGLAGGVGSAIPASTLGSLTGLSSMAAPISASAVSSLGKGATWADTLQGIMNGTPGSWSSLLGNGASSLIRGGVSQLLGGGEGDTSGGGMLAALVNAYSQNRQGNLQQDWADRLYQDRSQFLERLAQSYADPGSFLTSPDYEAISRINLDQLQRQDAAKGRLANDTGRQKLMNDFAFQQLENYRKGLANAAGLTGVQGLADLSVAGLANRMGTFNAPLSEIARGGGFDLSGAVDKIFELGSWF